MFKRPHYVCLAFSTRTDTDTSTHTVRSRTSSRPHRLLGSRHTCKGRSTGRHHTLFVLLVGRDALERSGQCSSRLHRRGTCSIRVFRPTGLVSRASHLCIGQSRAHFPDVHLGLAQRCVLRKSRSALVPVADRASRTRRTLRAIPRALRSQPAVYKCCRLYHSQTTLSLGG